MIEDEHPSSPEIKKTLSDLNAQWKDLYEKSMDKGHKLRQAADQHSLNKALADAQVCVVYVLKLRTLYSILILPRFSFFCSCFLKYSVEWQTV